MPQGILAASRRGGGQESWKSDRLDTPGLEPDDSLSIRNESAVGKPSPQPRRQAQGRCSMRSCKGRRRRRAGARARWPATPSGRAGTSRCAASVLRADGYARPSVATQGSQGLRLRSDNNRQRCRPEEGAHTGRSATATWALDVPHVGTTRRRRAMGVLATPLHRSAWFWRLLRNLLLAASCGRRRWASQLRRSRPVRDGARGPA
jgi:hypothetical protein